MTIEEILKQGLTKLVDDIIEASRAAGQEASGETYRHITPEVSVMSGGVYAPSYLYTLAIGRGPGKAPRDFAQIIMDWAQHKGIQFADRKAFLRWANAVAWKIRREGNKLYRNHGNIDIFETPIREFEEWLDKQLDVFYTSAIDEAIVPEYRRTNRT